MPISQVGLHWAFYSCIDFSLTHILLVKGKQKLFSKWRIVLLIFQVTHELDVTNITIKNNWHIPNQLIKDLHSTAEIDPGSSSTRRTEALSLASKPPWSQDHFPLHHYRKIVSPLATEEAVGLSRITIVFQKNASNGTPWKEVTVTTWRHIITAWD